MTNTHTAVLKNQDYHAPKYSQADVDELIQAAEQKGAAAERERAAAIVEGMMEDHEHWRPIAQLILTPTKDKGEDVSSNN